jgi:hypothetical protein
MSLGTAAALARNKRLVMSVEQRPLMDIVEKVF